MYSFDWTRASGLPWLPLFTCMSKLIQNKTHLMNNLTLLIFLQGKQLFFSIEVAELFLNPQVVLLGIHAFRVNSLIFQLSPGKWFKKSHAKKDKKRLYHTCNDQTCFTISPPVTTFVLCFSRLLILFGSPYCKQYGPRSDIICFHEKKLLVMPGIEPATPGLKGERSMDYTTAAVRKKKRNLSEVHLNICSRGKKQMTY